jgi:TRAP-type C4-dicarboxylate transport system permease small subunit
MRRIGTRLLAEFLRLAFAVLIAYGGSKVLQGPIESTCAPSEANPPEPSGLCAGLSGLFGAILSFFGAIILSVIAERVWRRRRNRRFANPNANRSY